MSPGQWPHAQASEAGMGSSRRELPACPGRSGTRSRPPGQSTRQWGESSATAMTTAPSFWQTSDSEYA